MITYVNFSLINLGCTKNLVDSQYFLGRLFDISIKTPEYQVNYFTDPFDKEAKIVFVNSCGFLSAGRNEADTTVRKLLKAGKTVYLLGCAAQYYKKLTQEEGIEHVYYLSRADLNKISLRNIMEGYNSTSFGEFEFSSGPRVYTNIEQKFEYLKIAEGCNNHCTFCIIPQIRGKQKSLPIEKVIAEAENMVKSGIKEIILIAQDSTRYGTDLYGKPSLLELLKKLDKVKGDFTYRVLYLYPDIVTLDQIKELKKLKKFLPYFDIPLQHISSPILKRMGRFYDEGYIFKFLDQIKKTFPNIFMRTNFIIGFPGETEEDFDKLMKFVAETKFDNIALFEYHDEPLAASSKLDKKVDYDIIRARFTKIRQLVNKQSMELENKRKGKEETGYIMEIDTAKNGKIEMLIVRPVLHCPEIDGYDEVSLEQVVGTLEKENELGVGDKIVYTV
ncbi:MAG: MiaB/RimO family radical SAM methylthiotransferase [candidate division SR1 bacterium]|nr:MiaB/RimO family radical SAM methylthiotransferase [candidate division SR1 bacterium]